MVGIRQNNLRARLFQIPREHPFYRCLRSDRHIYGRFNIPVRRMQNPRTRPRFRVGFNHFKGKKFVVQNGFRPYKIKPPLYRKLYPSNRFFLIELIIPHFLEKCNPFLTFPFFCIKNKIIHNIHDFMHLCKNIFCFIQKSFKIRVKIVDLSKK